MTTFTREDFEHAARAAGYTIDFDQGHHGWMTAPDHGWWCPVDDDGDALRLARHLRMTIADEPSRGGWSVGAVVNGAFAWLAHDEDQRAAIFRAAIVIGKAMLAPDVRPKPDYGPPLPVDAGADHQTATLFYVEVRRHERGSSAEYWERAKFLSYIDGGVCIENPDGTKEAIPKGSCRIPKKP